MSGHSKWATIHRAKGVKDAKKGAAFTKIAMAITVAVREGGGITDPDQNFRLRLAVDKARSVNMPKENITRSIERGVGGASGVALEEQTLEGFLPGGAAVLVHTLSDNKLRTQQQVRDIVEKNGGHMGSVGSVHYMFAPKGEIVIKSPSDERELEIIDLGVDDIERDGETWIIYSDPKKTFEIKTGLEKLGLQIESVQLTMKPTTIVEVVDPGKLAQIEEILTKLDDLDDVANVFTNYA